MNDDDLGAAPNVYPQQSARTLPLPLPHSFSSASAPAQLPPNDVRRRSRDTSSPSHSASALSRDTSPPSRDTSVFSRDTSLSHDDASASSRNVSPSRGASMSEATYASSSLSQDTLLGDSPSLLQDSSSRETQFPSHDDTSDQEFTCRLMEKELPLGSNLFIVNIPLRESQSSTSSSTNGISTFRAGSSEDLLSSSSNDSLVSSKLKAFDSSNNSSPSRASRYFSEDAESASDASSAVEDTDATSNNPYRFHTADHGDSTSESYSVGNKSGSGGGESSSLLTSSDESGDYELYTCQKNRNINAKKNKKTENASDKEPLVGDKKEDKGASSDASPGEKEESEKKRHGSKAGGEGRRGSTSEGKKGHRRQSSAGSRRSSKSRRGSKARRGSRSKGKDKKRGKKGKDHKKKKHGGKEQGSFNKFFEVFGDSSVYPAGVFFILGAEFCERFSYYGIRSVLIMYLTGWLALDANEATAIFHLFSCLAYISPIVGAALSDGALGRYKTILVLSVVYAIGCIIMAATAFPPQEFAGPMVGLFLVSFGTGGMKPCVVTFGGEQLPKNEIRHRATFFSTFYFIINLGSVLSILVTPVLRSDIHCVEDTCYPLAYGVPAILMTLAACVFFAGYNHYRISKKAQSNFTKAIGYMCCGVGEDDDDSKNKDAEKGSKGRKSKKSKDSKKHGRRSSRSRSSKSKRGSKGGSEDKNKDKKDEDEKDKKDKDATESGSDEKSGKDKNKNANKNAAKEKDTNQNKENDEKEGDKKEKVDTDKKDKGSKKDKSKSNKKSRSKSKKSRKSSEKPASFAKDVQMVKRILWLFIPLPVFWALFNQQGSRWTLQAAQLDGTFGNFGRVKPDQVQALNPLFIILFIPIFERVVYPCINWCGVCGKALHRIVAGMLFCALAFVLAALLQTTIDDSNEAPLEGGQSGYTIMNTLDCKINVRGEPLPFYEGNIAPFGQSDFIRVAPGMKDVHVSCPTTGLQGNLNANLTARKAFRMIVIAQPGRINVLLFEDKRNKSMNGTGYVSFLHLLAWVDQAKVRVSTEAYEAKPVLLTLSTQNASAFHAFEPGSYDVAFPAVANVTTQQKTIAPGWQKVGKNFEVGGGGVYTVALIDPSTVIDLVDVMVETYIDVKGNSVSMALIIPQYLLITTAEVLFSISGLAFAYSQAPESMKSVIQTIWLLTSALGDVIVILVACLRLLPDQKLEFYGYAILMFVDTLIFMIMINFYTYVNPADIHKRKRHGKKKRRGKRKKGGHKKKKDHKKGGKGTRQSKIK